MRRSPFYSDLSLITFGLLFLVSVSCKKTSSFPKDDIRYFQDLLEADMASDEVIEVLGAPAIDLNAEWAASDGLHIYQYPLNDTTSVRIGVADRLTYVCTVDKKDNLVEDIMFFDAKSD
ncbi:hypothetical protein WBG78_26860 [Chryseolinea sp. T2]|uniref:hypothetical protein n=1 Tax=Chryseolinea sp. T2 TaxID=3129255 RepID=UPI0030776E44